MQQAAGAQQRVAGGAGEPPETSTCVKALGWLLLDPHNPFTGGRWRVFLCDTPSLITGGVLHLQGEEYVNSRTLTDVTFHVEGRPFYAHRIALLASSEAFRAMFGQVRRGGGARTGRRAAAHTDRAVTPPRAPWSAVCCAPSGGRSVTSVCALCHSGKQLLRPVAPQPMLEERICAVLR